MPKQEGKPPFDDDELLHRRLIAAWALPDDSVDPAAIEFAKCSVDRGKFSSARDALARGDQDAVAVGSAAFGRLPWVFTPPASKANPPPKAYELVVVYEPELGNAAHTHLESRQLGEREPKKPGPAMRQQIRNEIAATMKVSLRRPR